MRAITTVGLAGSQARGEARTDSDVDLVVLTGERDAYLGGDWLADVRLMRQLPRGS